MRKDNLNSIRGWAAVQYRGEYKTAISAGIHQPTGLPLHSIVTRVNYLTRYLWLSWRKEKIKSAEGFIDFPNNKPNWLAMDKRFRKEEHERVLKHINK